MITDPEALWEILARKEFAWLESEGGAGAPPGSYQPPLTEIRMVWMDGLARHARLTLDGLLADRVQGSLWSLIGASLRDAQFNWSTMVNTIAIQADLSGMVAIRSAWLGGSFKHASLRNANLSLAIFKNVNFSGANLSGAALYGTVFESCNLSGVIWDDTVGSTNTFIENTCVLRPHSSWEENEQAGREVMQLLIDQARREDAHGERTPAEP